MLGFESRSFSVRLQKQNFRIEYLDRLTKKKRNEDRKWKENWNKMLR